MVGFMKDSTVTRSIIRSAPKMVATFFLLGNVSRMPGTLGSIVGVALSLPLIMHRGLYFLVLCFVLIASFWASAEYSRQLGDKDPKSVIIDEVIGQMLSIYLAILVLDIHSITLQSSGMCAINFLFFRIFDIFKPFPICYIDQNLKISASIVLDDLLAGVFSAITTIMVMLMFGHAKFWF